MSEQAVAILERARDKVAAGWVQGTGRVGDRVCAGQAIQDAWREITGAPDVWCMCGGCPAPKTSHLYNDVCRVFCEVIDWHTIPSWNDVEGRTQAQVIAAFNAAIGRFKGAQMCAAPKVGVKPRILPIEKFVIDAPPKSVISKIKDLVSV